MEVTLNDLARASPVPHGLRRHDKRLWVAIWVLLAHGLTGYAVFRLPSQRPVQDTSNISVRVLPDTPRVPEPLVNELPIMTPVSAPLISPPPALDLLGPESEISTGTAAGAPVREAEQTVASVLPAASSEPPLDWQAQLAGWIREHKAYPRLAQQRGQQGAVTVEFEVLRSGRVSRVRVIHGSGLAVLDAAALALLVDATVPPFTPEMQQQSVLITMVLDYYLQRRR